NIFLCTSFFIGSSTAMADDSTSIQPTSINHSMQLISRTFSTTPETFNSVTDLVVVGIGADPTTDNVFGYPAIPADWTCDEALTRPYVSQKVFVCYALKLSNGGEWGRYSVSSSTPFPLNEFVTTNSVSDKTCRSSNSQLPSINVITQMVRGTGGAFPTYSQYSGADGDPKSPVSCECETAYELIDRKFLNWTPASVPTPDTKGMVNQPYQIICKKWVSS
ncbi:MAG TPA: hypothetical protein VHM20_06820, partial [Gammaproteobacteria bacterium]|nr:hypothetical protein [Gammaproteobacteria bacterium]